MIVNQCFHYLWLFDKNYSYFRLLDQVGNDNSNFEATKIRNLNTIKKMIFLETRYIYKKPFYDF